MASSMSTNDGPLVAITRAVPVRSGVGGGGTQGAAASLRIMSPVGPARVVMGPDHPAMSRAELLRFVHGASVIVSMFNDRIDRELLDAAGSRLAGVCNFAVGYDNFDLAACRERGVVLCNCPDAVTEGTANLAWALILACTRMLVPADRHVRSGAFERAGNPSIMDWLGVHLTGQKLLIVGAGRIGMATALRGLAFGMRVLYTARSRHVDFELAPLGAQRVELDEGLATADVVSVHTPLTDQTRHLIDARRLGLMKPTAVIVNTARGLVIDEAALTAALRERRIWAAGLDVFEREPSVSAELRGLDNAVFTPHIGSAERYWREVMTEVVVANAEAILAGRTPPNRVA